MSASQDSWLDGFFCLTLNLLKVKMHVPHMHVRQGHTRDLGSVKTSRGTISCCTHLKAKSIVLAAWYTVWQEHSQFSFNRGAADYNSYRVFTRSSKRPALHLLEVCWIV